MNKIVGLSRPDAGHRHDKIVYDIKTQRPPGESPPRGTSQTIKMEYFIHRPYWTPAQMFTSLLSSTLLLDLN